MQGEWVLGEGVRGGLARGGAGWRSSPDVVSIPASTCASNPPPFNSRAHLDLTFVVEAHFGVLLRVGEHIVRVLALALLALVMLLVLCAYVVAGVGAGA
jgi:hypothetical protein